MFKQAQLDDVVKIKSGYRSGLLGQVVEVSPDAQLVRLGLTSNDRSHWFYVKELAVMYRPHATVA